MRESERGEGKRVQDYSDRTMIQCISKGDNVMLIISERREMEDNTLGRDPPIFSIEMSMPRGRDGRSLS